MIDGEVRRRDAAGPSLRLGTLAARPEGLVAEAEFRSSHMVYPYGAHLVQLRLDRETGGVTIERYLLALDVGRAVNPMLIEGQVIGGMAQGLGGALFEEFLYSETGDPLSVTFADYLMPTAREVPTAEVIVSEDAPSPLNTYGFKGAGEGGITAAGAAIASAIDDALQMPGAVTVLPVTPQRLKSLMARGPG
jgi:CO/xanthine dehydrogenase Mo-binding subunit